MVKRTPFALLKSFHGPFFWGLDEMHLFGANAGSKVWSIITDDGQKYQDASNPLFLRPKYREFVAEKMKIAQKNKHPLSTHGNFAGEVKRIRHTELQRRLLN